MSFSRAVHNAYSNFLSPMRSCGWPRVPWESSRAPRVAHNFNGPGGHGTHSIVDNALSGDTA